MCYRFLIDRERELQTGSCTDHTYAMRLTMAKGRYRDVFKALSHIHTCFSIPIVFYAVDADYI